MTAFIFFNSICTLIMPDLTDQILEEIRPDPYYHPLAPSYEDISEYADDLDCWGNQITIEWATQEMMTHKLGWVRLGLVADRVRRYRLYRDKFPTWANYCQEILGKPSWQMKKIINAAMVTMEIIREGYRIIPNCLSHAQKLLDCCEIAKLDALEAWSKVEANLPEQILITANNIGEVLGFKSEKKRVSLPSHLQERLSRAAADEGVTIAEKIEQMLDDEENIEPITEEEQEELEEKEQLWHRDLKNLIEEHDREIWLMTAISKLIDRGKRKISQFAYLRQFRYQT